MNRSIVVGAILISAAILVNGFLDRRSQVVATTSGVTAAIGPPGQMIAVLPASQEKTLKSHASDSKAQITFVNKSGQRAKVYWLDFSGHRALYKVLEAGESYEQQTFLTHPWLVADASDNPTNIFLAGAQPGVVEIAAPIAW